MNVDDLHRLSTFNAERSRGVAHTSVYRAEMDRLQRQFDREKEEQMAAGGWVRVGVPDGAFVGWMRCGSASSASNALVRALKRIFRIG